MQKISVGDSPDKYGLKTLQKKVQSSTTKNISSVMPNESTISMYTER
jgi:hypothetical protein